MQIFKKLNILLLEDDVSFASSLTQTLELYFKYVYFATNIKEANEICEEKKVDVVMSDIHLEKENGLDFISQIKNENKDIPIVIISGFNDKEYLMQAIKLGVIDYLVKPFDLEDIEKALKRCKENLKHEQSELYMLKENIYFDMQKRLLFENHEELTITSKEYLFLKLAIDKKGYILSKEMIEEVVYGLETMSPAALKNLLFRIRKKLGKEFIETLPELGYRVNL